MEKDEEEEKEDEFAMVERRERVDIMVHIVLVRLNKRKK